MVIFIKLPVPSSAQVAADNAAEDSGWSK